MASVKFGSLITGAAGKVGGQILQRGRTGSQLRNLSQPVRVRSSASSIIQQNFSSTSSKWKSITNTQRTSWNDLAATLTRLNKWGDTYVPTGFQIFCEFNLNKCILTPDSKISDAPAILPLPDLSAFGLSAVADPKDYTLEWANNGGALNWQVVAYIYGITPSSQSYSGTTPRLAQAYAAATAETLDLNAAIAATHPITKVTDMTVVIGYRLIESTTGQGTPIVMISGIIT